MLRMLQFIRFFQDETHENISSTSEETRNHPQNDDFQTKMQSTVPSGSSLDFQKPHPKTASEKRKKTIWANYNDSASQNRVTLWYTNIAISGIPPIFNRIHTSSIRVHFSASYISLPNGTYI